MPAPDDAPDAPAPSALDATGAPDAASPIEATASPDSASTPDGAPRPARVIDRIAARWGTIDGVLYPLFAGACVLTAAAAFYGSMHQQTHGVWSAPLDDVFIHFDYARATARGYPFQWSEGNGFSSGNTSLSYPFVLALGYWSGFRALSLMLWAAIVACVSTLGFLLASARLAAPLGRWAKYLIPPAALSLGALDWSLFSGMENAFHLGVWGLALVATLSAADAPDAAALRRRSLLAGLAGALLFATRPESVVCVAAFGVFVGVHARGPHGLRAALIAVLRIGSPGALVLVAQSIANRVFTGEWSANGAIAKLAINNPYMTSQEKWAEYVSLLKYVIYRNIEHHFTEAYLWGWLVPAAALIPLLSKKTRGFAILLWASIVGWLGLVALNGQVRWQNERYTMAAVAWLFVLAAMGLGVLVAQGEAAARLLGRAARPVLAARIAAALAIAGLFHHYQRANMRDQIWFFGRASRNILDQHILAGRLLGQVETRRVLVGDAGALLYASDRPGLDIIGLGGYHDLPFARATVHGLGAAIELIERMRPSERPDTMAIYPSWWGDLPTIFGKRLTEVPVFGNVICGGSEKVIYRADWSTLDRSAKPRTIRPREVVIDELDVADLVSEKSHRYVFPHPSMGFVDFRVLSDPADRTRDVFDAGRLIPGGQHEIARVRMPSGGGRLVVRTAAGRKMEVAVAASGRPIGKLELTRARGWIEPSIDLPAGLPAEVELALTPIGGDWLDCHVWILAPGEAPTGQDR